MFEKGVLKKIFGFIEKYKYMAVFVVLGIFLITFPTGDKKDDEVNAQKEYTLDVKEFERKIADTLSECDGVGRVEVVLSIDSGSEYIYANESRKSSRSDEKTNESDSDIKPSIMSEGSGKESPVLIKEIYPEFRGAVVVCDGAASAKIRVEVSSAVAALTGLSSDKISIIKMKK